MGCEHVKIGNTEAIICSRGRRRQVCSVGLCGRPSVALCDYPVERSGKATTCDSPMCERHRHTVAHTIIAGKPEPVDYCEGHYNYEQRKKSREHENDAM